MHSFRLGGGAHRTIVAFVLGLSLPLIFTACGSATSIPNTTGAVSTSGADATTSEPAQTEPTDQPAPADATTSQSSPTSEPTVDPQVRALLDLLKQNGYDVDYSSATATCTLPKSIQGDGMTEGTYVISVDGSGQTFITPNIHIGSVPGANNGTPVPTSAQVLAAQTCTM